MMTRRQAVAAAIRLSSMGRRPSSTPLLVVFSGPAQSNTIGLMDPAMVTGHSGIADPFPAVQFWQKNAPGATPPPTFTTEGPEDMAPRTTALGGAYLAGLAGVELSMLRDLAALLPTRTLYGIKLAVDGSSAVSHWATAGLGVDLVAELVSAIDTQCAAWGFTPSASTMLLVPNQGEADTAQTYAAILAAWESIIVTSLRGTYGNFPVLYTATTSTNDTAGNVRAAQTAMAAKYPPARWVSCNDIPLRDAAHYTDQGYADLGSRLAVEAADLLTSAARSTPYIKAIGPVTVATSVQSITPTLPPHEAGDVLVLILAALGNTSYTLSTPAGFTSFIDVHDGGSALNARLQCWWKRCASSSESVPTIADAAGDDAKTGVVINLGGCAGSGDFWSALSTGTEATDTSVSFPSLADTAVSNTLVLNIIATRADVTAHQGSAWENPDLAGVLEMHDDHSNTGAGYGLIIVEGRKASAGAVQATTGTLATTTDKAMATIAVKG